MRYRQGVIRSSEVEAEPLAGVPSGPTDDDAPTGFQVNVSGFEGPFDLLLSLIAKQKLEVTALALHQVTDDFIQHIKSQGDSWDLDETTEFLVIAAILLDLKAARLLPGDDNEDQEDLALLEARDLLFARLLQYRAFKEASIAFETRLNAAQPRHPRTVGLDPHLAQLLPEVVMAISPEQFAAIAVAALTPKAPPVVATGHVHAPTVNVREQVARLTELLRDQPGGVPFKALVAGCPDVAHVIARFLGLLQLYTQRAVSFEQDKPLGDLVVTWIGDDASEIAVSGEFDDPAPNDPAPGNPAIGGATEAGSGDSGSGSDAEEIDD